jgi:hypothetical protein
MEPLMIGVDASDDRLPETYDALASLLEGKGTVYIPHVIIPSNARMAVIRPPSLVVALASADVIDALDEWANNYLSSSEYTELRFQREHRSVVLSAADVTARRGRLRGLVCDQ